MEPDAATARTVPAIHKLNHSILGRWCSIRVVDARQKTAILREPSRSPLMPSLARVDTLAAYRPSEGVARLW